MSFKLANLAAKHQGFRTDALNIQANLLLLKVTVQGLAILRSIPTNRFASKELPLWDLSTVANSTRSILESYLLLFHLFVDPTDDAEKFFRFCVWHIHGLREQIKFRETADLGGKEALEEVSKKIQKMLKTDSRFKSLTLEQQKNVLAGERATIPKLEKLTNGILEKTKISDDVYYLFISLLLEFCSYDLFYGRTTGAYQRPEGRRISSVRNVSEISGCIPCHVRSGLSDHISSTENHCIARPSGIHLLL